MTGTILCAACANTEVYPKLLACWQVKDSSGTTSERTLNTFYWRKLEAYSVSQKVPFY